MSGIWKCTDAKVAWPRNATLRLVILFPVAWFSPNFPWIWRRACLRWIASSFYLKANYYVLVNKGQRQQKRWLLLRSLIIEQNGNKAALIANYSASSTACNCSYCHEKLISVERGSELSWRRTLKNDTVSIRSLASGGKSKEEKK